MLSPRPLRSGVRKMQEMQRQARTTPCEIVRTVTIATGIVSSGDRDETGGWTGSGTDEPGSEAVSRVVGSSLARIEPILGSSSLSETVVNGPATQNIRFYDIHLAPECDIRTDDRIAVPGYLNKWTPDTAIPKGRIVIPTRPDGWCYVAIQAGVTGSAAFLFRKNASTADNTVVWAPFQRAMIFDVRGTNEATTVPDDFVARCEITT